PPPSTRCTARRGSSSTVEPQPSKLMVRVRFPSPAPLLLPPRHGTSTGNTTRYRQHAHVAQSVEHLLGKEEVDGSIPFVSTNSRASRGVPARFPSIHSSSEIRNHGKGQVRAHQAPRERGHDRSR